MPKLKNKEYKNQNYLTKFPKGFFNNIKLSDKIHSKEPKDKDIPFKWSENVLNGKSKIKIVSAKK